MERSLPFEACGAMGYSSGCNGRKESHQVHKPRASLVEPATNQIHDGEKARPPPYKYRRKGDCSETGFRPCPLLFRPLPSATQGRPAFVRFAPGFPHVK